MHNNQWVSPTDASIPAEWWAACYQKALPGIDKLEPWVISLDAAVSGDTFGLVARDKAQRENNRAACAKVESAQRRADNVFCTTRHASRAGQITGGRTAQAG